MARSRLDGVYEQATPGRYMLRVKVHGARFNSEQAIKLCSLARAYAGGKLHLTTRMSVEFHGIDEEAVEGVLSGLAEAGLTSRGACGPAVRGVAVSTPFAPHAEEAVKLARMIADFFTGNADYESLPKKFKVGVDGSREGGRHLIQDAAFVYTGSDAGGAPRFELWIAGGLGRKPKGAFLLASGLGRDEALPFLKAMLGVYSQNLSKGKRLKQLAFDHGEAWVREHVFSLLPDGYAEKFAPLKGELVHGETARFAIIPLFAGELEAGLLEKVADVAKRLCDDTILLTPEQNLALGPLPDRDGAAALFTELERCEIEAIDEEPIFRVCAGNHECKLGLCATRDVARAVEATLPQNDKTSLAISGCPNSCAQPQLAEIGIIAHKGSPDGSKEPRFKLLVRKGGELGEPVADNLSLDALLSRIDAMAGRS